MNYFVAKNNRNEINKTLYSFLYPWTPNLPSCYDQVLDQSLVGYSTWDDFFPLTMEMNFQNKSSDSHSKHFWNNSWHLFSCTYIHLFVTKYFLLLTMNNCFVSYCENKMRLPTFVGRNGFWLIVGSYTSCSIWKT